MRVERSALLFSRMIRAAAATLLAVLAQCGGGGGGQDCTPGAEACACLMGQCFNGLQCLSDVCVEMPGSDVSSQPSGDTTVDPTTDPTTDPTAPTTTGASTTGEVSTATTESPLSTSGVDPTGASSSTGEPPPPPPVCGDGNVDPGEECDDGDDDDANDCGNDCNWNGPLIVYVDPVTKNLYGETLGDAFDDSCDGVVGGIVGDEDQYAILAVSGRCKRMVLQPAGQGYALKFEPGGDLPWRGTQNGNTVMSLCDPSAVAIGFTIDLDGPWVEGLRTTCAPISLVGDQLVFGNPSDSETIGGADQKSVFLYCPEGSVVTGYYGHASERVYGFSFHCAKPVAILD